MPIKVTCPSCSATLRAPDTACGKKIRCPKCSAVTRVPTAMEDTMPGAPGFGSATVKSRQGEGEGDSDEDQPARRDKDGRPRRRRGGKGASANNSRLWLGLAVGGLLGIMAVVVVLVFVFFPSDTVVSGTAKEKSIPGKLPQPKAPEPATEPQPQTQTQEQPNKPKPGNVQFPIWRTKSANNLSQLAKAMHLFHDSHKAFPYAKSGPPAKKGQLSWRVAILPELGQLGLYRKFNLEEPWDSPHNKRVLDEEGMPGVFASPSGNPGEENKTYYQIITGPRTAWPNDDTRPRLPGSYPNGTSNTFLIVEAETPVYWTQPEDLTFDGTNVPPLGGIFAGDFHAAMADASVRFIIRGEVPDEAIRASITASGR